MNVAGTRESRSALLAQPLSSNAHEHGRSERSLSLHGCSHARFRHDACCRHDAI
jgi:hypothetical protein